MNAISFLVDRQRNAGFLRWNNVDQRMCNLVSFWSQFDPEDRPFQQSLTLKLRDFDMERYAAIPLMMFAPEDLINLARFNGANGALHVPKNYS